MIGCLVEVGVGGDGGGCVCSGVGVDGYRFRPRCRVHGLQGLGVEKSRSRGYEWEGNLAGVEQA